ncbi:ParA family protein [Clostridiales bacterium COT073_COT-073]|nr:ParA family protein [Clostridiales bacterium COT073_COT-073]
MGRVIAVANQKGGVGKTTTAVNLSACLAEAGQKTLIIDSDPQGNTTQGLGVDKTSLQHTTYDVFLQNRKIYDIIGEDVYPDLDLLPANIDLAGAEIELIQVPDNSYILKKAIAEVKDQYDFILIDCPPSLSLLTINALTAADTVLVPLQCEFYALEGLSQLMYTIRLIQNKLNPELSIEGIVFTMYDARTNLSLEVVEEVKNELKDTNIYQTIIPRNVRLSEAPSYGQPIAVYDPNSKGAVAYRELAREVIARR